MPINLELWQIHVILSALTPEQVYLRWQDKNDVVFEEEEA